MSNKDQENQTEDFHSLFVWVGKEAGIKKKCFFHLNRY